MLLRIVHTQQIHGGGHRKIKTIVRRLVVNYGGVPVINQSVTDTKNRKTTNLLIVNMSNLGLPLSFRHIVSRLWPSDVFKAMSWNSSTILTYIGWSLKCLKKKNHPKQSNTERKLEKITYFFSKRYTPFSIMTASLTAVRPIPGWRYQQMAPRRVSEWSMMSSMIRKYVCNWKSNLKKDTNWY